MPIFDLALPDGRTLTLEAPDESAALGAATQWHQQNPKVDAATDIGKGALSGLQQGAINTAGFGGDVRSALSSGVGAVVDKLGGSGQGASGIADTMLRGLPIMGGLFTGPTSQEVGSGVKPVTGDLYKPQSTAGKYAKTIGEFIPGAALPGGIGRRLLGNVLAPAIGSETGGQMTEGTEAEPYARLGGAVLGGMAPSALSRVVTPLPAAAGKTAAVNTLRNEGVTDITAGQATGRKGLQYFESERGGRAAATSQVNQAEQFTAATLRRAGETANRATPEVVEGAFARIGQQFDELGSRNSLQVDRRFGNDIANLQGEYSRFANPAQKQTVHDAVNDIVSVVQRNNGVIPGAEYNVMRSRLGTVMRGARRSGDNQVADAYSDMIQALDDGMERAVMAAGNPADVAAWREARNQYRNLLVIERAAVGAGEQAADGLISPAKLRQAMTAVHGKRSAATGRSDFSELSRAGNSVLTPLPNSGTAQRLSAQNLGVAGASTGLGAALGGFLTGGNPIGMTIGGGAGAMLPPALGRLATSGIGRAYLGNQVMADQIRNAPPQLQQAIINSLLARRETQPLLPAR
jgi:hypothetical protein